MDAWNKGRSHTAGGMDRRWCTSHRLLLGLTFNREEGKRRNRRRTFTDTQTDACWDGVTCLLGD